MHNMANAPSIYREHQLCFFESHFTELKLGWISGESGTSDPLLRWDIGGNTKWSVNWEAGVWHNVSYEIVCLPEYLEDLLVLTVIGLRHFSGFLALHRLGSPDFDSASAQRFRIIQWCRLASWCS